MPRPVVTDQLVGFSGLNTASDPLHLGPTETASAVNAKWTLYKGLTPRWGSQRVADQPLFATNTGVIATIQNLLVWQSPPGGIPQLVVVAGARLFTAPMAGPPPWTFTDQGGCSGLSMPGMVAFTDATTESVYISDNNQIWKWNGTTLTNINSGGSGPSAIPTLTHLAVQNLRMLGVNNTPGAGAANQTLYFSSPQNGDDIGCPTTGSPGAGGSDVLLTFGASTLTDLVPYEAGLLIGQLHGLSTFVGYGPSDISIQTGTHGISADIGCYAQRALCPIETFCFVASPRGAYVLSPWGFLQQISKPIDNIWQSIVLQPTTKSKNTTLTGAITVHDGINHSVYILGVQSTARNPITGGPMPVPIYGYNYRTEGWFGPWFYNWNQFAQPNSLATGYDALGNYYVLAGGTDGIVRQLEVPGIGLDDVLSGGSFGMIYTMDVLTKPMFGMDQGGSPLLDQEKAWRWVDLQAQLPNPVGASVTVHTYPQEGVTDAFQNNALAYNNQVDNSPRNYRVQVGSRGQAIRLHILDTPANNPANQNVYMSAKAVGFNYGRRY